MLFIVFGTKERSFARERERESVCFLASELERERVRHFEERANALILCDTRQEKRCGNEFIMENVNHAYLRHCHMAALEKYASEQKRTDIQIDIRIRIYLYC